MANSDVLVRMKADTKNYDANIAKARRQLDQFKKDNLSLGGVMKQSTAALTGMAAQFIGVAAAIGAAKKVIGDMVRINKQFEQGTAVLASIIGKTTDEISALTNQAKQLGATTRYTAMQITELQTNLARLGFTEQEILNSTKAIQAFATATGADLGEAANLAGAALRGFGMNATEMERAASVMAVSTTKSALSFEKLATAIPIVAPVAKQFGFTIEDTVTLLAKLSDAGMDASTAATATRNIFLKMANDSGKLSQALGRPVHSVEEFGEALKEMREKGMSLNDILSMVGVRSTAAFAVFADNADTLKDFKQSITDCGDAMGEMENKQLNTLQGSITILNSAWEGLMLTFSESNGVIKTVVDSLSDLLQAYTRWRNRNQGGDAAIQSYELSEEDVKKKGAELLKGYREATNGRTGQKMYGSDDDIKNKVIAENEALNKQIEELKKLEKLYAEYDKWVSKADWHNPATNKKNERYLKQFNAYGYGGGDESRTQLQKDIAAMIDKVHVNDYIATALTPAPVAEDPNGKGGSKNIKLLKAQYEAEEKEQIAALDRKAMNEEEYEAKVYEIKKTALERIAKLYDEDTREYAQVRAKMAQLDIQYQGTQYRRGLRADREAERAMKSVVSLTFSDEGISNLGKQIKEKLESAGFGTGEYLLSAEQLVDFNNLQTLLSFALKNGLKADMEWFNSLFEDIKIGADVDTSTWQALVEHINALIDGTELNPFKVKVETGGVETATKDVGKLSNEWVEAAHAVGQFGSALQSVEDPTAKIAGIIAQAIASVAAGAGSAIAQAGNGSAGGPWGWVAFAISATATMISTIAAIKSVTSSKGYAQGGIVGGNSYSGDQVVARLNSGEGVLTRVGLDSAARMMSAFDSQVGGGSTSTPFVTGEKIILGVNNFLGRSGQGEIVTTSMLRRAGVNI